MNKVIIMGRLCKDIELRETANGVKVCSFTLAVDRYGTEEKQTDFIDCVAWRKTAEFIDKYFGKGSPMVCEGTLQTRNWEKKDGTKMKSTEVIVDNVEFVPRATESKPTGDGAESAKTEPMINYDDQMLSGYDSDNSYMDDLPF